MSPRHRLPVPPPPPPRPLDRWTVVLGTACAVLIAASLIAFYGTGVAPDASAAGREELIPPTATTSPTRYTVQVPIEILPVTPPSIGAEGAWDPTTDPPLPGSVFAGASVSATVEATTAPEPTPAVPPESVPEPVPAPETAQSTDGTYPGTWTYSPEPSTTTPEPTTDAPPPDPTEEPTMPIDPLEQIIDDVLSP